jgi:hypothetical protein
VPKGTEKLNRDALKAGIRAAKRAMKEWEVVKMDDLSIDSAGG